MEKELSSGDACLYRSLEFEITWFKSSRIAKATQRYPASEVIQKKKKEENNKTYFDKSLIQKNSFKKKYKNYELGGDVIR